LTIMKSVGSGAGGVKAGRRHGESEQDWGKKGSKRREKYPMASPMATLSLRLRNCRDGQRMGNWACA